MSGSRALIHAGGGLLTSTASRCSAGEVAPRVMTAEDVPRIACRTLQKMTTSFEWLARRISLSGQMSRSQAEAAIRNGEVVVDGQVVRHNVQVSDHCDVICRDQPVEPPGDPKVWLINKPRGVVCSATRIRGLTALPDLFEIWYKRRAHELSHNINNADLIPPHFIVINPIPVMCSGLVVLTNDGEFAHNMAHPRSKVLSVFLVRVKGRLPEDRFRSWRRKEGVQVGSVDYGQVFVGIDKRPSEEVTWLRVRLVRTNEKSLVKLFRDTYKLRVTKVNSASFGPYRSSTAYVDYICPQPVSPHVRHLAPRRIARDAIIAAKGTLVNPITGEFVSIFDQARHSLAIGEEPPPQIDMGRDDQALRIPE
ncbi:hypothetical protein FOZ60_009566 [Perkinsus olseni]|uniref:RNA-binding S4 domain-containing protein n=1 Tax=Perkinsus olseni TaxID=32597 RepID=A0A7J6NI42_PEROL|nr:hypothetical protein FOZ60_009566 [Perkinsus olseni]